MIGSGAAAPLAPRGCDKVCDTLELALENAMSASLG
jgi:hypothetical protein